VGFSSANSVARRRRHYGPVAKVLDPMIGLRNPDQLTPDRALTSAPGSVSLSHFQLAAPCPLERPPRHSTLHSRRHFYISATLCMMTEFRYWGIAVR